MVFLSKSIIFFRNIVIYSIFGWLFYLYINIYRRRCTIIVLFLTKSSFYKIAKALFHLNVILSYRGTFDINI